MAKTKTQNLTKKSGGFNIPLKKVFIFATSINLLTIAFIVLLQNSLPPQVPLFYGLAEGEEQLTTPLGLLIAPGLSTTILLINTSLSTLTKNDFLQKTLILSGFAVGVFSTITIVKIILLVGSF